MEWNRFNCAVCMYRGAYVWVCAYVCFCYDLEGGKQYLFVIFQPDFSSVYASRMS